MQSTLKKSLDKPLIAIFLSIITFCIFLKFYFFRINDVENFSAYAAIALLISLFFFKVNYTPDQKPTNILIKGISIMLGLYALINYQAYLFENPSTQTTHNSIRYLAVLTAVLSLWKPSFSLFPLTYTVWRKEVDTFHIGLKLSPTDYMPIIEVGLILLVGYLIISILHQKKVLASDRSKQLFTWVLIAAIGIHFGNYFHSGLAKLMLDGGPFGWLLENNTHYLIITSLEMGLLPIGSYPYITQSIFNIFEKHYILFNSVTLLGQLICIYMITSPRKIIIITLFYDLMHISIYLLTGIFFWKWIVLNILIVTAMSLMKRQKLDFTAQSIGIIFTLTGILAFFTAQLAWYDTKSLKHTYIEAKDIQGNVYPAPTNYFTNASLAFTQGRLLPSWPGHFYRANTLGSTDSYRAMKALNKCEPIMMAENHEFNFTQLTKFIEKHHNYVLINTNQMGRFNYDYFPHHVWSNPLLYSTFNHLDKRDIVNYRIIVESKCLKLDNGAVAHAIVAHSVSPEIPVK